VTELTLHLTSSRLPERPELCVAVQKGRDELVDVTPVSSGSVTFDVPVSFDGDWRGPFVQGPKKERFLYLVWGPRDDSGEVIRQGRSKIMLGPVSDLAEEAAAKERGLTVDLDLTDGKGGPRHAQVKGDAATWRIS
jgi:Family of unknown function (DUF5990)